MCTYMIPVVFLALSFMIFKLNPFHTRDLGWVQIET